MWRKWSGTAFSLNNSLKLLSIFSVDSLHVYYCVSIAYAHPSRILDMNVASHPRNDKTWLKLSPLFLFNLMHCAC